jgi:hypothetical protein
MSHGDASWGYVATLLALAALYGGPRQAAEEILRLDVRHLPPGSSDETAKPRPLFDDLLQDLRNGLQLARHGERTVIADPDVLKSEPLVRWIREHAAS